MKRARITQVGAAATAAGACLALLNLTPAAALSPAEASSASVSCQPARQVVARQYAGPDTSVTVMAEARLCSDGYTEVRANGRNERSSGKSDWAVALKIGGACHSTYRSWSIHPNVGVGGNQATEWEFSTVTTFYWWAEVSTTYPDGRHYTGKTSCWRNPGVR